jgi:hypothetical protein
MDFIKSIKKVTIIMAEIMEIMGVAKIIVTQIITIK